jgi:hypothetical protein
MSRSFREVAMEDVEIESLLEDAGFCYDIGAKEFVGEDSDDQDEHYTTQDIADALDIPVDDLVRWEEQRQQADAKIPG